MHGGNADKIMREWVNSIPRKTRSFPIYFATLITFATTIFIVRVYVYIYIFFSGWKREVHTPSPYISKNFFDSRIKEEEVEGEGSFLISWDERFGEK